MSRLGAFGLILALGVGSAEGQGVPPAKGGHGYTTGHYGLEIDGVFSGWLHSAEGGHAFSDVVLEKVGPDHIQRKHLAGLRYQDIVVTVGPGFAKPLMDWMSNTLGNRYTRKNGAIVSVDYDYKEHSRLEFTNALISEITFPTFDAASKDPVRITVRITPERTRMKPGTGGPHQVSKNDVKSLVSDFRLEIDGLDSTHVNKIEAITVKQKVVENAVGELRDYEREPAHLECGNLVVTLAESHAAPWEGWLEDFLIQGKNGPANQKNGTLHCLAPDLRSALFTLKFSELGIFKLSPERSESGSENIRRLKAELYVTRLELSTDKAVSSGAPPAPAPAPAKLLDPVAKLAPPLKPESLGQPAPARAEESPEDQGARDPADFPRCPGSIRKSFQFTSQKPFVIEKADYTTQSSQAQVDAFYSKRLKDLGWEESQRYESGDPKKGSYVIDFRWTKGNRNVQVLLRQAEKGLTNIMCYLTTDSSPKPIKQLPK